MRKIFMWAFAVTCLLAVAPTPSVAKDLKGWGVVLMHGKGGGPNSMAGIASALSAAGATVVNPQMSWGNGYRTYSQTLDEVAGHIAALRQRGATRIALVGQSLGTNVALGYGAQRGGIAAIVAMAPGHQPDKFIRQPAIQESLERAKKMVASGHGGDTASFADTNQGSKLQVTATAAAYVSFFDPAGPAIMSRNAAQLRGAQLLWILGADDAGARSVAKGGKIINISGGHFETPRLAAPHVVDWLESL